MVDHCQHFLFGKELVQILDELLAPQNVLDSEWRPFTWNLIFASLGQVLVAVALVRSVGDRLHFRIRTEGKLLGPL